VAPTRKRLRDGALYFCASGLNGRISASQKSG
jgi:hypothetical protein